MSVDCTCPARERECPLHGWDDAGVAVFALPDKEPGSPIMPKPDTRRQKIGAALHAIQTAIRPGPTHTTMRAALWEQAADHLEQAMAHRDAPPANPIPEQAGPREANWLAEDLRAVAACRWTNTPLEQVLLWPLMNATLRHFIFAGEVAARDGKIVVNNCGGSPADCPILACHGSGGSVCPARAGIDAPPGDEPFLHAQRPGSLTPRAPDYEQQDVVLRAALKKAEAKLAGMTGRPGGDPGLCRAQGKVEGLKMAIQIVEGRKP